MNPLRAIARVLLALPLLALTAQGCVRLDEPEAFRCNNQEDCLEDETCGSRRRCLARGACDDTTDCQDTERCLNGTCAPAECTTDLAQACGGYKCNLYTRSCLKQCTSDYECTTGNLCDVATCRPVAGLANGNSCKYQLDCLSKACCGTTTRACAVECKF